MKNNLPRLSIFNADHEGNTRVVFSAAPVTALTKTASMESVTNSDFQNYPTGGSRNSLSLYNHTTGGTYSQLLNGGNNSQIGVAKSYKVYPGDKVKINAYAKYANLTSNTSNVSAFASALLNTFLLPAPLAGEVGTASRALNDWGSIVAVGGDGQSNAAPRVSVNIIVFDKNYNFLDVAFDQIDPAAEQVGVTPVVAHDLLSKEYTVKEEGYVFMYIANENQTQVDAYFDDVAMTYTPTNIVQYNEYYPFGLQATTSWTRENNTNNFLYNEGSELNADAGWYETMFRGYDATLGRFMQVDPLAHLTHNMSPYQYANNSPVLRNDPYGLKSPAPPGVSQMGWDRINKIRNPDFYTASWAESFSEYNRERDEREGNYDGGGGIGGGFGGNGSGYYSLFEYRYFYDDGVEAANKRHTEWEWVEDQTQEWTRQFVDENFGAEFATKFSLAFHLPAGLEDDESVKILEKKLSKVYDNFDYYLTPEATNPIFTLSPISYDIQIGDKFITKPLVPQGSSNTSTTWGNPGMTSSDDRPIPLSIPLSSGNTIRLLINFQQPFP